MSKRNLWCQSSISITTRYFDIPYLDRGVSCNNTKPHHCNKDIKKEYQLLHSAKLKQVWLCSRLSQKYCARHTKARFVSALA